MDFLLQTHGSICILLALTDDARAWVEANLPADRQQWGQRGTAIEPRYVQHIIDGIEADGMSVRT